MENINTSECRPFENPPGTVVMKHRHDSIKKDCGLEFTVTHLPEAVPDLCYEASTPHRSVAYGGRSPEEAIGALLLGMMFLARDGSINPNNPRMRGVPPIQHVIEVLNERLIWQIERRRERLDNAKADGPGAPAAIPPSSNDPEAKTFHEDLLHQSALAGIAKDNEIISALATSIAALARVKDL